jgi:rRNA maturation RNase YbeY
MNVAQYDNCTVTRQTPGAIPVLPYSEIVQKILGKKYDLSLVYTNTATATHLNESYKHHSGPANILSFPLTTTEGEIFITLARARSDAKKFEQSYQHHLLFLIIHGALHLAGHVHGNTMEQLEKKWMSYFVPKL